MENEQLAIYCHRSSWITGTVLELCQVLVGVGVTVPEEQQSMRWGQHSQLTASAGPSSSRLRRVVRAG